MIFTTEEEETIYKLAESITGSSQRGTSRKTVIVQNVKRRAVACKAKNLAHYLHYALSHDEEYKRLLSAMTIHFTNWFRESDVFNHIFNDMKSSLEPSKALTVLCAACSSGEEVYSLAMFLEDKREQTPGFDYIIHGIDIDPISIASAKKCIYSKEKMHDIPARFQKYLAIGSGSTAKLFTLSKEIRNRCHFHIGDIRNVKSVFNNQTQLHFDVILCRNVLIYFDPSGVQKIVSGLVNCLHPNGILCLGHSETITANQFGLKAKGQSIFKKPWVNAPAKSNTKGEVLVVDDSLLVRKMLSTLFERSGYHAIAAESSLEATKLLARHKFDLITLDLHMPEQDGITWLREQRSLGLKSPVVIVSDASPSEADDVLGVLSSMAQDYIEKKELQASSFEVIERMKEIITHFKTNNNVDHKSISDHGARGVWQRQKPELICVGASTGGTEALIRLLRHMPSSCPPIVVVQHISANFAIPFAQRLAREAGLNLGAMKQDEDLKPGHLYIALGDYHIGVKKKSGRMTLDISHAPYEHSVRPAVDFLFRSAASLRVKVLAALLTGMGKDGALGLLDIKNSQGMTMSQSEDSCIVYGMPKEAEALDASQFVGDLLELRREIDGCMQTIALAS